MGEGVAGVLLEGAVEEGDRTLEAPGLLVPLEGAAALGVGSVAEGLAGQGRGLRDAGGRAAQRREVCERVSGRLQLSLRHEPAVCAEPGAHGHRRGL